MPEQNKPFVITDRRKFTKEGELRPDVPHSEAPAPRPVPVPEPPPQSTPQAAAPAQGRPTQSSPAPDQFGPASREPDATDEGIPPPPTPDQIQQARFAYEQTAERLEIAIRSANPGADHPPAMNFDQLVQSIYLTAIMQLGGAASENEKPRVDILGARQSIDMLAVVGDRTRGNLTPQETTLVETALFELRMAFLEITQALARSAATREGGPGPRGGGPPPKPGLVF